MPSPPRATLNNPYGPQVTFRTEDVLPPSALYLSMNDTTVFMFLTNTTNTYATVFLRLLMPDGTVQVDNYPVGPFLPLPQYNFLVIPPTECYLMSCNIAPNLGGGGSVWCTSFVIRGTWGYPFSSTPPYGGMVIVQGYLDDYGFLAWPNSPVVEPGTGAGKMRNIQVSNVTGANWTLTVPSLTRWEVISVQCTLTSSAAVGNREFSLVVFDYQGNSVCRYPNNFLQGPSLQFSYYYFNAAGEINATGNWVTAPMPTGLMLDGHWQLQGRTLGLDVADAWSFISVHVREWAGVGTP